MEIELINAGKRYQYEWIFRQWSGHFSSPGAWAITGSNGSGKSTALRALLGYAPLSEGSIEYRISGRETELSQIYRYMSICAPYLELYEELTLLEMLRFHASLKPLLPEIDISEVPETIQLGKARNKPIKHFSSGMKQRLRLGLALLSDVQCILLDEPLSNLDQTGARWYDEMIQTYRRDRLLMVASNNLEAEYHFCRQIIKIEDFKPS